MKLGIGISCYNKSNYVLNLLDNLKSQICPAVQVFIIDDKSTDGSYNICMAFSDVFNVAQNSVNLGAGATKNLLVDKISKECDYFTLIDADDDVALNYVDRLLEEIEKDDFDILTFGTILVTKEGLIERHPMTVKSAISNVVSLVLLHCSGCVNFTSVDKVYRSVIITQQSFSDDFFDDNDFSINLFLNENLRHRLISDCLYIYNQLAEGRITQSLSLLDLEDYYSKNKQLFNRRNHTLAEMIITWRLLCHIASLEFVKSRNKKMKLKNLRYLKFLHLAFAQRRGVSRLYYILRYINE